MLLLALSLHPLASQAADLLGKVTVRDKAHHALKDASDVVVFIDEVNGNKGFHPPSQGPEMASREMKFEPSVLPVLAGTTVHFPNKDIILHNVFSLSKTKPFDLGLYEQGQEKSVTFDSPGLVKVYCNIHEKMVGTVLVLGNPYFTLTDQQGRFTLKNVPNGAYTVVCWYRGGMVEKEVHLAEDRSRGAEMNFDLVIGKIDPHHKNKWGKDYSEKY